ncbi:MAG: hypothetical protein GXO88_06095 [Chlorobi bacterium]|nr:hypothetical protein [Chlorobiota bacterium]
MMKNHLLLRSTALAILLVSVFSCSTKCDCDPDPYRDMLSETDVLKTVVQVSTTNLATGFETLFENIYTNNALEDSLIFAEYCQAVINPIRFFNDESGYFFVETNNAWMVAHATKPELIGTNRMDVQDLNGKYYVRDMVEAIDYKGFGFVDYYFENPANGLSTRKLAFVKSIPAAQFFIGTGFYENGDSYYFTSEEAAKAVLEVATKSMGQGLKGGFDMYEDSMAKVEFCRMFIDNIRFFDNQSGYFFVYDFNCVNVAHGAQKDLQGENLYDYQDSKGNYVIRDLVKIAKTQGSGYYDYYWNNPISGNEEPKTAFVYKLPGMDYFVGSGIYY